MTMAWNTKPLGTLIADWFRALFSTDVPDDPWPHDIEESIHEPEALPVCHHCFKPLDTPGWFCPECGSAEGPYNNTMPFLTIFSIGEVARSGVDPDARFTKLTWPGYVFLGLSQMFLLAPFYFFRLFRNWRRIKSLPGRE